MIKTSRWFQGSWLAFGLALAIGCAEGDDLASVPEIERDSGKIVEGGKYGRVENPEDKDAGAGGAVQDAEAPSEGGSGNDAQSGSGGAEPGTGGTVGSGGVAGSGGIAGSGGSGGGGPIDPYCTDATQLGGGTCGTCQVGKCAGHCNACVTNSSCTNYVTCLNNCNPEDDPQVYEECEGKCAAADRIGRALMVEWKNSVISCVGQNCQTQCNYPSIKCGSLFDDTNVCGSCINTKCGAQCTACMNNPDCQYYWACSIGCGYGKDCLASCKTRYPIGEPLYKAFMDENGSCVSGNCNAECKPNCNDVFEPGQCATCNMNKCFSECTACLNEPDCLSWYGCHYECRGVASCENACNTDYPKGSALLYNWLATTGCLGTKCENECF